MIFRADGSIDGAAVLAFAGYVRLPIRQCERVEKVLDGILRGEYTSVYDASRMMFVSRRQLTRWFREAGAPPPQRLLMLRRYLVLWKAMQADKRLVRASVGVYCDPFQASNSVYRDFGVRPKVLARMTAEDVVSAYFEKRWARVA